MLRNAVRILVATGAVSAAGISLVGTPSASAATLHTAINENAIRTGEVFQNVVQHYQQRVVRGIRGYADRSSSRGCYSRVPAWDAPRQDVYRTVNRCRRANPGVYH